MEKRPLGRTGIEVTNICLGTMTWGEQNTEAEAHTQMDMATDYGVNFFDTAEMYPIAPRPETQGRTEAYIGSWFTKSGKRDHVILATKVAGPGTMKHIRNGAGPDKAGITAAIETSLKRLQTDYVDLYQIHWPARAVNSFGHRGYGIANQDQAIPIEDSLEAMYSLVQAGKVRAVGLSNETPWGVGQFLKAAIELGLPRIASIQNAYSLVNRHFELGLSEFAHREAVGLLAYSPLASGFLTGKYVDGARPPDSRLALFGNRFRRYAHPGINESVKDYLKLATDHGLNPAQMALAFVTSQPFVTSNIIGATSPAQLEINLQSSEVTLSEEVLTGIEKIHERRPNLSA